MSKTYEKTLKKKKKDLLILKTHVRLKPVFMSIFSKNLWVVSVRNVGSNGEDYIFSMS